MANEFVSVDFSEGQWDRSIWLPFKSLRFDYIGGFDQERDHIVNRCPAGVDDETLYARHVTEVYASLVHPLKACGGGTVTATMSFDHLMAPLIVLTPELDVDEQGRHAFKKHYEVVLYNEGINVWHYTYKDGTLDWHLAAFARAPFEAKKKYTLTAALARGKREMRLTVSCGGVTFGFEDPELPQDFYAGVTGCEGRNRFYDFSLRSGSCPLDPLADGEH